MAYLANMRALTLAITLAVAGCSSSTTVDWENYSPTVKQRIDKAANTKDCTELQTQFDNADQTDNTQRKRVGDGNADLMKYVDTKMRETGC